MVVAHAVDIVVTSLVAHRPGEHAEVDLWLRVARNPVCPVPAEDFDGGGCRAASRDPPRAPGHGSRSLGSATCSVGCSPRWCFGGRSNCARTQPRVGRQAGSREDGPEEGSKKRGAEARRSRQDSKTRAMPARPRTRRGALKSSADPTRRYHEEWKRHQEQSDHRATSSACGGKPPASVGILGATSQRLVQRPQLVPSS